MRTVLTVFTTVHQACLILILGLIRGSDMQALAWAGVLAGTTGAGDLDGPWASVGATLALVWDGDGVLRGSVMATLAWAGAVDLASLTPAGATMHGDILIMDMATIITVEIGIV